MSVFSRKRRVNEWNVSRRLFMQMTPDNWDRAKELFEAALELDSAQRASFLAENCRAEGLRQVVEKLLVNYHEAGNFLKSPALNPSVSASLTTPQSQPESKPVLGAPSDIQVSATGAESEDPMVGRQFGAYRLLRRVGQGGMAAVFLADRADDEYRKQVAVKLVQPGFDKRELLDRFRKERQTLAGLDHPNIVRLLDGGSTPEGLPFLVMDYVEGVPIDEYCDQHKLSVNDRLHLFGKVCDAVQYAHRNRVIHRDLKPSNVLVIADGTPKLLDFGIAKVLTPEPATQSLQVTRTGIRCMTPAYASPEQMRGKSITTASDIYSLGVVLYELLTGRRPYRLTQQTPVEVERAICEQDPESPSTAVSRVETDVSADGIPITKTPEFVSAVREGEPEKLRRRLRGDLDNIVLKALQKEPDRRYHSVEEFSQDIVRHLRHLPVAARPSTLAYRAAKLVRRHKAESAVLVILVFALLGAVGFSRWQRHRALEEARAELGGDRLPGRPSVAVLGFKNLSNRQETAWVSTALSEMLAGELGAGGKLRTVPDEEVAHMKIDLALPEPNSLAFQTLSRVRRYLKSDYMIAGSYLDLGSDGGPVRLDLRLQDAAQGETLASLTLKGTENDLPDLAARAGAALRDKLGAGSIPPEESAKVKAVQPSNLDALRLYSEGVERLLHSDPAKGRSLLQQSEAADSNSALTHAALAEAWGNQGYDAKAKEEANKALALAAGLPREQSLSIEGEALRVTRQWVKDAEIYRTLFTFFPDNLNYGVRLVTALSSAGKGADAMAAVAELRNLPKPLGDDPRVDLAEARAAETVPDFNREVAAATRAAEKAKAQGTRGLQAQALFTVSRAFVRLGQSEKGIAAAQQAQQLWAASDDRYGVARALNNIGIAEDDVGRYQDAERAFSQAENAFHDIGNRWNEAAALLNLGVMRWRLGDNAGAKQKYEKSLAISRELGNLPKVAIALTDIAVLEIGDRSFTDAKNHLDEALGIDRARGDDAAVGDDLSSLTNLYLAEEDIPAAKKALDESIQIHRKAGQKNELGQALGNLGNVHFNLGEMAPAEKCYAEALQLFTETGNQIDRGLALRTYAEYSLAAGNLADARKNAEESLGVFTKMNSSANIAGTQEFLAELSLTEGNLSGAESLARKAVEGFRKEKNAEAEGDAQVVLARVLREQGKLDEAQASMASARELNVATHDREKKISLSVEGARLQAALGKEAEAKTALLDALAQAKKADLVPLQFQATLALGEIEIKTEPAAGKTRLASLEGAARRKGFLLIARRAAAPRRKG